MQEVLKRAQEGTPAEPGKDRGEGAGAGAAGGREPPPTRPGERVEPPEGQRRLMQLNRTNPQHRQIMEQARQLHPIDKEAARKWLREQGYDA